MSLFGIQIFNLNKKKKEEDEGGGQSSLSSSTGINSNTNTNLNASTSSVSSTSSSSSTSFMSPNDHQPSLNEIQLLSAHTEAVKTLLKIDDDRLASAGDDTHIYIWSIETGQIIYQLRGHTNRVTCLLYYQDNILVSGSMDKTIRMWDLSATNNNNNNNNGRILYDDIKKMYYIEAIKVLNKHVESVKFLEKIPNGFCSASNDEDLLLWHEDGTFKRSIIRSHKDYINGILCVNNDYILTAGSSSPYLVAYRLSEVVPSLTLQGHNGCINCLMNISDKYFVTGSRPSDERVSATSISLSSSSHGKPQRKDTSTPPQPLLQDKTIIIWNSSDFSQLASVSTDKSISYLYKITDTYLLATIFKGFSIFDIYGNLVLEYVPEDPDATTEINGAISLYDNTRLISWADVRLSVWSWSLKEIEQVQNQLQSSKKKGVIKPMLIGEMRAHTDYMNCLTVLDDHSIATGSSDKQIIMWKDGKYQSSIRNHLAGVSLYELQLNHPRSSSIDIDDLNFNDDDINNNNNNNRYID